MVSVGPLVTWPAHSFCEFKLSAPLAVERKMGSSPAPAAGHRWWWWALYTTGLTCSAGVSF